MNPLANFKRGFRFVRDIASKKSPELAASAALVAGAAALWKCYKATQKLDGMLQAAEIKKNEEVLKAKQRGEAVDATVEGLTTKEKIPVYAKCYLSTFLFAAASAGLMIASVKLGRHQLKAAMLMYTTAQNALEEYEKATEEVVGENKAAKIKGKVAQNAIEKNKPAGQEILDTGYGKTLCYDMLSGRYFRSDQEFIRRKINNLNADLLDCGFVSLNDYYESIGLTGVMYGSSHGWHYSTNRYGNGTIHVGFEWGQAVPGCEPIQGDFEDALPGEPTLIITMKTEPKWDYHDDFLT
jgi:hypothetical protein